MKKFTFMLIAVAISTLGFAQMTKIEQSKIGHQTTPQKFSNNVKSAWIGGGFDSYYTGAVAGDEFYIVGSEFSEIEVGDEITKVKFYHYLGTMSMSSGDVTFDNTSYTIKVYENPTLAGPYVSYGYYSTDIGTPVYTETITLDESESGEFYEMTLATPYTVTESDFWIAVCFDNGKGAMRLGELDETSEGKYYMYWDGSAYGAGTVIGKPNFGSITEAELHPIGISLYVDDGEVYEEQSDLTIKYLDTYPSPTEYITEKSITESEDLIIYPVIKNNGLDATNTTATVSATIDGNELLAETIVDLSGAYSVGSDYYTTVVPGLSVTITASEMDALSISGLFDICYTVTYNGSDPITTNNTSCLTVTRGSITSTTCDIEAIFATSIDDFTPIATDITIGPTEDLTFFAAAKNNGSDEANNYADVNILVNGNTIDTYTENLTGLANGETMSLTETGYELTAAIMDIAGISGTFDVCLTVTYTGTDPVVSNNTSCISITRGTVNVASNLNKTISVFPNPANNVVNIANAENSNITVINMLGQVVSSTVANSNLVSINTSDLSEGTYLVRIANGNEVTTQKINVIR